MKADLSLTPQFKIRNSSFAIRTCHGSFSVFILGWTIGAISG